MRMIHRRLAFLLLGTVLAVSPYSRSADTIPASFNDAAFWRMVNGFSEQGGFFRFQFMSNEREFPSVIPALKKTVKAGGVYLGVGPEQNFTYIAATRPKIAFIFDIRRQNMIEHLIYKAVFETSANRVEFIAKLFSRKAPPAINDKATVRALFQAFTPTRPDPQLFRQNLQAIKNRLTVSEGTVPRFPISSKDLADIDNIYQTIFDAGPGIDYSGPFGGYRGGATYASLMTATDDQGQTWSYLANEENYQFVREMERRNAIVPLVGDFAGTKAIRTVGEYLKEHGAAVTTFYTSNVEQYLFQQGDDWRHFYTNVATLPMDASSTFIRSSHYSYGTASQRSRQFTGSNYVMLMCSMMDLARAFRAGRVQTYDDVIRMSSE